MFTHLRYRTHIPRYRLRTLLLAVLVVAVLIRVGQWAWPKYVLYRQGREYAELQATKQPFIELQREQLERDRRETPQVVTLAVDYIRPIPDDFAVLVRRGNTFGCFIPRKQGQQGLSVEYDWYYRTDGMGRFAADDPNVHTGGSSTGPGWIGLDTRTIKFGPFELEWNGGTGWGYVYYHSRTFKESKSGVREQLPLQAEHLRICTTDVKSVELLDARDAKWIYRAYNGDEGVPGNVDISPQHEAIEQRDQKTVNEY
jgi:hypothetical protein